ncbi:MAG: DUF1559 domain-containing protein [Planctomycetota bacterium]
MSHHMRRSGLTLTGVVSACAIAGVVMGMLITGAVRVQQRVNEATCANNLRQIALALEVYHQRFNAYPPDAPEGAWLTALRPFVSDWRILECPEDEAKKTDSSYESFYVLRGDEDETRFVLGCPRHGVGRKSFVLFGEKSVRSVQTELVQWTSASGIETRILHVGDAVVGGVMTFADGSVARLDPGLPVRVLQTFRTGDGRLYTIVRVLDGGVGTVQCHASTGSRFEVVTPAIIAGAEGTAFSVSTYYDGTGRYRSYCRVTESSIYTVEKSGRRAKLHAVAEGATVGPYRPALHTHWHRHLKNPDASGYSKMLLHRHEHAIDGHHSPYVDTGWHFPGDGQYVVIDVKRAGEDATSLASR